MSNKYYNPSLRQVPRNAKISVGFSEPMNTATVTLSVNAGAVLTSQVGVPP